MQKDKKNSRIVSTKLRLKAYARKPAVWKPVLEKLHTVMKNGSLPF